MKITIFTPTYNRGYCIKNLYKSLINQNDVEFEWLIVDDGSNDNTEDVIKQFIKENKINIKYFKQKNSGKYKAINLGIDKALGELFFIVDSDDYLIDNVLEVIWKWYENLKKDPNFEKFIGISGLRKYKNGSLIGSGTENEYTDATVLEYRYKLKIKGDKSEIFITDLLKRYKFPIVDNSEKFQTEAIIFNKMGQDGYKIRWYNEPIYITEYLEDGLSSNPDIRRRNNWNGYTYYYNEIIKYDIPYFEKIRELSNYFRFGLNFKNITELRNNIHKNICLVNICTIIGLIFNLKDKIK